MDNFLRSCNLSRASSLSVGATASNSVFHFVSVFSRVLLRYLDSLLLVGRHVLMVVVAGSITDQENTSARVVGAPWLFPHWKTMPRQVVRGGVRKLLKFTLGAHRFEQLLILGCFRPTRWRKWNEVFGPQQWKQQHRSTAIAFGLLHSLQRRLPRLEVSVGYSALVCETFRAGRSPEVPFIVLRRSHHAAPVVDEVFGDRTPPYVTRNK